MRTGKPCVSQIGRNSRLILSTFKRFPITAHQSQTKMAQRVDEVDPALLRTYERLGIPLHEQKMLSVSLWMLFLIVSLWQPRSKKN